MKIEFVEEMWILLSPLSVFIIVSSLSLSPSCFHLLGLFFFFPHFPLLSHLLSFPSFLFSILCRSFLSCNSLSSSLHVCLISLDAHDFLCSSLHPLPVTIEVSSPLLYFTLPSLPTVLTLHFLPSSSPLTSLAFSLLYPLCHLSLLPPFSPVTSLSPSVPSIFQH